MQPLDVLYIAALILGNGFFVAAEFALVKVRTSQIDQLAEEGRWAAKLTSRALDHLDAYLSASQIGITVASLALGQAIHSRVQPAIERFFSSVGVPVRPIVIGTMTIAVVPILALTLVTFLHTALGEQAPKNLAIRAPRWTSLVTSPILVATYYLFWPVIWLLNVASHLTLRLIGLGKVRPADVTEIEEELRHVLGESVAGGALTRSERVMIENVLDLEEKTAKRVMVPRPDIVYLSLRTPLEENLQLARQAGHTRYPLCEDDLTNVVGMIHVKDLFRVAGSNGRLDLRKLARKLPFVPETIRLDVLLRQFQQQRNHLAMLLDEYGEVVGMVTLENVLEELVGPIQDEFDFELSRVVKLDNGAFDVDATCPVDVLEDTCGVNVPEDTDAETAGGLILEALGRLARVGDGVVIDGHRLIVIEAETTRIRRIRVEPVSTGENKPELPTG